MSDLRVKIVRIIDNTRGEYGLHIYEAADEILALLTDAEPGDYDATGAGWALTTERGQLRRELQRIFTDENGLSFAEAIDHARNALDKHSGVSQDEDPAPVATERDGERIEGCSCLSPCPIHGPFILPTSGAEE